MQISNWKARNSLSSKEEAITVDFEPKCRSIAKILENLGFDKGKIFGIFVFVFVFLFFFFFGGMIFTMWLN